MLVRLVLILFIAWGNAGAARPADTPPEADFDTLMAAIYDGAAEKVERIMTQTRAQVQSGAATEDDLRRKFDPFSTTDPKIYDFVQDWMAAYPESPYARTANARIHATLGWNVRGTSAYRQTYPAAHEMYVALHEQAHADAMASWYADRGFLPAADTLQHLSVSLSFQETAFQMVRDIMAVTPNWGTLKRAIDMTDPDHGGTSERAEALCLFYGPKIPSASGEDMTTRCLIYAAMNVHVDLRKDRIRGWLETSTDPALDRFRVVNLLNRALQGPLTPADRDRGRDFFLNSDTQDYRLAAEFDRRIGATTLVEPIVLNRARDAARKAIRYDPYNPTLLTILRMPTFETKRQPDGSVTRRPMHSPTVQEQVEYTKRKLVTAPYNPVYWEELATFTERARTSKENRTARLLDEDALYINAIVYSNHDPGYLRKFILRKLHHYDVLAPRSALTSILAWTKGARPADVEGAIICPILRANTLLAAINVAHAQDLRPYRDAHQKDLLDEITARASAEGLCTTQQATILEHLLFEPVKVDLGYDVPRPLRGSQS